MAWGRSDATATGGTSTKASAESHWRQASRWNWASGSKTLRNRIVLLVTCEKAKRKLREISVIYPESQRLPICRPKR